MFTLNVNEYVNKKFLNIENLNYDNYYLNWKWDTLRISSINVMILQLPIIQSNSFQPTTLNHHHHQYSISIIAWSLHSFISKPASLLPFFLPSSLSVSSINGPNYT
jgi:hypothetical protein